MRRYRSWAQTLSEPNRRRKKVGAGNGDGGGELQLARKSESILGAKRRHPNQAVACCLLTDTHLEIWVINGMLSAEGELTGLVKVTFQGLDCI